jgi:hypothetical protein
MVLLSTACDNLTHMRFDESRFSKRRLGYHQTAMAI